MFSRLPARSLATLVVVASLALAACGSAPSPTPTVVSLPAPTCGGLKILIEGALPCDRVARVAVEALAARAPEHLARGVTAIDVVLRNCDTGEVPPQVVCGGEGLAQYVTVTFGPGGPDAPIEPSLTVAVAPVSGGILGIANPLVR